MSIGPVFGPIRSGRVVEQAALTVLRAWLPAYLFEVERQNGLGTGTIAQPPSESDSYVGGVDFERYVRDDAPVVVVVVNPDGEIEFSNDAGYTQRFGMIVGAVVFAEEEDDARQLAWLYGEAIQAGIDQNETLGGLVQRSRMERAAEIALAEPDNYNELLVRVAFSVWVTGVANENFGPGGATANIVVVDALLTPQMRAADPGKAFPTFTPVEHVADAIAWLCSDGAAEMNGRRLALTMP